MKKIYMLLCICLFPFYAFAQVGLYGLLEFEIHEADTVILCDGTDYSMAFTVTYIGDEVVEAGEALYYWTPNLDYWEDPGFVAASGYTLTTGDEIGTFGQSFNSEEVQTLFSMEDSTQFFGPFIEGEKYLSFIEFFDPGNEFYDILFYEVTWCGDDMSSIEVPKNTEFNINLFPNPASQNVQVRFDLKKNMDITINIFDINGRLVQEKYLNDMVSGNHIASLDLSNLSSGMYILQFSSPESTTQERLVICD